MPNSKCRAKDPAKCRVHGKEYIKDFFNVTTTKVAAPAEPSYKKLPGDPLQPFTSYQDADVSGYNDLIDPYMGSILVDVRQDDYQGDSLVLLQQGANYGIMRYGWGSCSGCDAYEGCNNRGDLQELQEDMWRNTTWYRSASELKEALEDLEDNISYLDKTLRVEFSTEVNKLIPAIEMSSQSGMPLSYVQKLF
jgi:hypothetical protein